MAMFKVPLIFQTCPLCYGHGYAWRIVTNGENEKERCGFCQGAGKIKRKGGVQMNDSIKTVYEDKMKSWKREKELLEEEIQALKKEKKEIQQVLEAYKTVLKEILYERSASSYEFYK